MASKKEYLTFVADMLSPLGDISYKPMMGEYVIYYNDIVVGGIYDDRLLIKITDAAKRLAHDEPREFPYVGGKEMLSVGDMEREKLLELIKATFDELPKNNKKDKKAR